MIPSATTLVSRMSGVRLTLAGIGATGLALAAALALSSGASAADPLRIQVGTGSGTVGGQAYLPGKVTVEVGQPITFTVATDEPHSVTFGTGPDGVAPDAWPVSGWTAPGGSIPVGSDLGEVTWDGSSFMNTGLIGKGSSATISFTTPGTYIFSCVIHPGMSGEVDVVEEGAGGTTTQEQADAAAQQTADAIEALVEPTRQARLDSVETTRNSDGTTTWNVFADASTVAGDLPGGGTGYLELYEMIPQGLAIGVGDTVHWSATGVHTVTFPAAGQDPRSIDPFGPAVGGDTYDGTSEASSGLLNAAQGSPSSYTLTFPTAGVFDYVCALHQSLGQQGIIAVGQPLPSGGPSASVTPAASEAPAASGAPASPGS